jgi:hypothetical protein
MRFLKIIVITLLIIIISLAIGNQILINNIYKIEKFQNLSLSQIQEMNACIPLNNTDPSCINVNYYDLSGNLQSSYFSNIPKNLYLDSNNILQPIPYGNIINPDNHSFSPFTSDISNTKFNINNFNDVQYHQDPTQLTNSSDASTAGIGKMWVLDNNKNLVSLPYNELSNNTLYYQPGSFRFSSSNYVPNYEESIYLSKLTNISSVTPIQDINKTGLGFCEYNKNNPDELERVCNSQSSDTCASTKCCVLLGGQKCVYGNENGPYFKTNYSNFLIKNPEFYYYQGKCYGNCQ